MLNILINAYAIAPNWGSEQGMGWNWTIQIAKFCKVYVITEGQWKDEIEEAIKTLPQGKNITMYYHPVADKVRNMCWNQGDYRFYFYYDKWQREVLDIAKDIINQHKIDIIHQLNMVGFREPGQLWRIKNIPFVWGCISGFSPMYLSFTKDISHSSTLKYTFKNIMNWLQVRYMPKVRHAFNRADAIITLDSYSQQFIKNYYGKDSIIINETGIIGGCVDDKELNKMNDGYLNLLWVGRFIKTKRLDIAIKTIAELKDKKVRLHIVGFGFQKEEEHYKNLAYNLGIEDKCIWYGKTDNSQVQNMMKQMDGLFFTSIAEATSTVVPEAIKNRLPIICHDACAFGTLINETIGFKIKPIHPEYSVLAFSKIIIDIVDNPAVLDNMKYNFDAVAELLKYDYKGKLLNEIYMNLVGAHN